MSCLCFVYVTSATLSKDNIQRKVENHFTSQIYLVNLSSSNATSPSLASINELHTLNRINVALWGIQTSPFETDSKTLQQIKSFCPQTDRQLPTKPQLVFAISGWMYEILEWPHCSDLSDPVENCFNQKSRGKNAWIDSSENNGRLRRLDPFCHRTILGILNF